MQIREMTITDYEAVCALWRSTNIKLSTSDEKSQIARMIEWNPRTSLVGELDGQIVGAVLGGFDGRRGLIHHLAIAPSVQGRGYGGQLMDELEKRYIQLGIGKTHLFVAKTNLHVVDFYRKRGYQVREDFVPMSKSFSTGK